MRVKLQLVMCSNDGHEETIIDLLTLQKDFQRQAAPARDHDAWNACMESALAWPQLSGHSIDQ